MSLLAGSSERLTPAETSLSDSPPATPKEVASRVIDYQNTVARGRFRIPYDGDGRGVPRVCVTGHVDADLLSPRNALLVAKGVAHIALALYADRRLVDVDYKVMRNAHLSVSYTDYGTLFREGALYSLPVSRFDVATQGEARQGLFTRALAVVVLQLVSADFRHMYHSFKFGESLEEIVSMTVLPTGFPAADVLRLARADTIAEAMAILETLVDGEVSFIPRDEPRPQSARRALAF